MSAARIPVADPHAAYLAQRAEIDAAVARVLAGGRYILGPEVEAFEAEFAAWLGLPHFVGVASGTDALALALRAVGVLPGDEVIAPSHTAVATVAAIEQVGAVPVLADVDPRRRCICPTALKELVTERTRALVVVHIYGQPADLPNLLAFGRQHGLKVIEDCAQSHGASLEGRKVGTWGDAAAFSFYPTKNLGALGDGGGVATRSTEIAGRLRELRQYGWRERYVSHQPGLNSRLDELQAAILRIKLKRLSTGNERRRAIARCYRTALTEGVLPPAETIGCVHAMHLFVAETTDRDAFRRHLATAGIDTALHYPLAVHQQPAYVGRIQGARSLSVTEELCRRIVSLPMYPELTDHQVERICSALSSWRPKKS